MRTACQHTAAGREAREAELVGVGPEVVGVGPQVVGVGPEVVGVGAEVLGGRCGGVVVAVAGRGRYAPGPSGGSSQREGGRLRAVSLRRAAPTPPHSRGEAALV